MTAEAPSAPATVALDRAALDALSVQARQAPRRRVHRNLHATPDDPVNRLAIAIEPGSYVRPHRHPARGELLLAVRGAIDVLLFDDGGALAARHRLAGDATAVLELPAGTCHTLHALEPGSVFFEVKRGPYEPTGSAYAHWAPEEGSPQVTEFLGWLARARPGDRYPAGTLPECDPESRPLS